MRKKKKEITPVPVETDFYTEALKAFDVVLPPSQEELEAQRQAEEEKIRKRTRRLRAAVLAVAVAAVALLLWRPWEKPPVTQEPGINWPLPSETKIGFHVYTVPDSLGVSYIPYTGDWELSGAQVSDLLERLEALNWDPMAILSSIPSPTIGDITVTRDGETHKIHFNANGILFAEGYMAKPDAALWNDLFSLLQKMTAATNMGSFAAVLPDGSRLYLDILGDGSFVAAGDQGILYSGYWGRVDDFLLLYTSDPRVGFATFRVGNEGGIAYLEQHDFWLLQELKGCGPLYPATTEDLNFETMSVQLSWPGASVTNYGTVQLTQAQSQKMLTLLNGAQWFDVVLSGYMPQMCGGVTISAKQVSGLTTAISLKFSHDGWLYDGFRYARLSDEEWTAFVELLALAGKPELAFRMYRSAEDGDEILLAFGMDGKFEYRDDRDGDSVVVMGNYLQLGNVVLLAGPNGLREILLWDRDSGDLTAQFGEVLQQIPILYGTTYPAK